MHYLKPYIHTLKDRSDLTPEEISNTDFTRKRASTVEYYILIWFGVATLLTILVITLNPNIILILISYFFATIRIIEIILVTVNVTVFDRFTGRSDNTIASSARIVVLTSINFVELALWFGILYALGIDKLIGAGRPATAFYLSFMTQTTIGYSNVYPTSYLRIVAVIQGLVAILFLVLVIARIITALPPINAFRNKSYLEKN